MSLTPVAVTRIFSPAPGPNLHADPLVVLGVCLRALEAVVRVRRPRQYARTDVARLLCR